MVLDERGEKTSKITDIHYREMCQIHETLFKNQLFGTQPPEPAEPAESPEVVSASAAQTLPSTRAGGQDDGSSTNSLKLAGVAVAEISNLLYYNYVLSRPDSA